MTTLSPTYTESRNTFTLQSSELSLSLMVSIWALHAVNFVERALTRFRAENAR